MSGTDSDDEALTPCHDCFGYLINGVDFHDPFDLCHEPIQLA